MHERGARRGALEIHDRGLGRVLDLDEVRGVPGRRRGLRDDDRDRLPGVERDRVRERRVRRLAHPLDRDHGDRLLDVPEVGGRQRRDDAGMPPGRLEADRQDPGVRRAGF